MKVARIYLRVMSFSEDDCKRLSRYRASSRKDAASRWMLICRNSLTELITIY